MMNDGDVITKVWMLLDIIHKASSAGPAYAKWAMMAREELENTRDFLSQAEPPDESSTPTQEPTPDE